MPTDFDAKPVKENVADLERTIVKLEPGPSTRQIVEREFMRVFVYDTKNGHGKRPPVAKGRTANEVADPFVDPAPFVAITERIGIDGATSVDEGSSAPTMS